MVMSLKSSRLRQGTEPPEFQTQPRWTGSFGKALTVDQCAPRSYVVATYRCHAPLVNFLPVGSLSKLSDCVEPRTALPRNAKAARSPSPAMTSANSVLRTPAGPPASTEGLHVCPRLRDTATFARPVPSAYPK